MVDALSWLSSALAATATYNVTLRAPAPEPTYAAPMEMPNHDAWELRPGGQGDLMAMHQAAHVQPQARGLSGGANLATRYGQCLDVPSGRFANGQIVQSWACDPGNKNQQWKLDGKLLRTDNNKCLDVPGGYAFAGQKLQIWDCDANNRNQWFQKAGPGIRKVGTSFCLDQTDGRYQNAMTPQLYYCDYSSGGNQVWAFGNVQQTSQQNPSSFLGYTMLSWPAFAAIHPELAKWSEAFVQSAASVNIPPTLLGAIAMLESSGQERPNNGAGLMQWMDDATFRKMGGGDKQKASDAIWAAARYIRYLLDQNGQNLDAALRGYNGPISSGGEPRYQERLKIFASGGDPWN